MLIDFERKVIKMTKKCISCGNDLPENACFCHYCTTFQHCKNEYPLSEKSEKRSNLIWWSIAGILCLILVVNLVSGDPEKRSDTTEDTLATLAQAESSPDQGPVLSSEEPQAEAVEASMNLGSVSEFEEELPEPSMRNIYEGGAEITYIDSEGSYHVFLCFDHNSIGQQKANATWQTEVAENESLALPSQLAAYHFGTTETANEEFLEKVERITVQAIPSNYGKQMTVSVPDYDPMFPNAATVSHVVMDSKSGANTIQWSIEMKNGDNIILEQKILVFGSSSSPPITEFTPDNAPMGNIEELKALLERINMEFGTQTPVTVQLPPVVYEGDLEISGHTVHFVGSMDGEQITTFTGTITVSSNVPDVASFRNIHYIGNGGTAMIADAPVELQSCYFSGYDTAIIVNSEGVYMDSCSFSDNREDVYSPMGYELVH